MYLPIPDATADISPNITFKTDSDKAAITKILQSEFSEVQKFNEAPKREAQEREKKAAEFVQTLEKVLENKPKPDIIAVSPHFEHRALSEAEKRELIAEHLESIKKTNSDAKIKHKPQTAKHHGKMPQKFPQKIDPSKSLYQPPDVVATGYVKNIIQAKPDKKGPKQGHWAVDKYGKPIYRNGQRLWIEGQHNYNRQRNPYEPDEPILGTRLMNNNVKLEQCRDEKGNLITDIDIDARIVKIGVERKKYDRSTQTEIIDDAMKAAIEILKRKSATYSIVPKVESKQSLAVERAA